MLLMTIVALAKNLINLIYPLHCASCRKPLDAMDETGVCRFCISQVRPNPKPYCRSCGRSLESTEELCADCKETRFHFERAYSACLHEGAMKELIHSFKYKRNMGLGRVLSEYMANFLGDNKEITDGIDAVTFVPLHPARQAERGFNQSQLLADTLARSIDMPFLNCLKKIRSSRPQNELTRDSRLTNLRGAFKIRDLKIDDLGLLLIDDVMTTGATLDECSRVLLDSGAKKVKCLTLARGV